jgi:uncharacterized protein (DUF2336 family)
MSLNYDDVHQLIKEPSVKVRSNIAKKVASSYCDSSFTSKSNKIALDILRLLLKDTEKQVRLVLARELKHNISAPHDIIFSLAQDEAEVAEEVLRGSKVLQDSDLIELINLDQDIRKMIAISEREFVSTNVTDVLIDLRRSQIVHKLLQNDGAHLTDASYSLIIDEFSNDSSIVELLVCKGGMSFILAEKLYYMVSEKFKKNMTKRQLIPVRAAEKITTDIRESMILKFLSPWMTDDDLSHLVDQMHTRRRLTDGLIMRALCAGEIEFFEVAIAKRVGIPVANARKLLKDNDVGFGAVYRSSKLPAEYKDAVKIMLKLVREEIAKTSQRSPDFTKHLLDNIKRNKYHINVNGMSGFTALLEA